MDETTRAPRWLFAVALVLVLAVAAGLRLYRLPELPLGLHYDEAANGILAGEIARGEKFPIFIPSYTGKEVLFFYWTALWMRLLGATPLALRLGAALVGVTTVAATAWAVWELLRPWRGAGWAALLAAALLAASFWHLVLSRYGFRAVTQPLLQALTVAALWRALRYPLSPGGGRGVGIKGLSWSLLAGLFCGLTAYTYLAARAFPIPLATGLAALLAADRERRRAHLVRLVLFAAAAALTLAPLSYYWLTHPGSFLTRTGQVAAGSWIEAWDGVRACLGMFFADGDPYVRFNVPHRPIFDPVTAVLFLSGIAVLVFVLVSPGVRRKLRLPAHGLHLASGVFLLSSLLVMILPSALATGEITPSNLRAVGLLPFIYVFPALGVCALVGLLCRVARRLPLAIARFSSLVLLLVSLTSVTAIAYFRDWAPSAALYYAADGDLVDVAAYLNRSDLSGATPYVASVHYRHPTLAFLAEDYGQVRWLTGGRTLVFPAEGEALLVFPRSASRSLSWVRSLLPGRALDRAPPGPDGVPAFHAYRVAPGATPTPARPLAADLGHTILLLGYDVVGEPRSGEEVELAVWWRVMAPPDRGDYGPVVRLADPWGFLWGENVPFHSPSEQWSPGEVIVDLVSVPAAAGAPPGDYLVRFGLYSPGADRLLPVLDDAGRYAGTYAALPVRLARAPEPPDVGALGIRTRLDAQIDGLTLLGANLDTASAHPGEPLYLTLFWRADGPPLSERDVVLLLGDTVLYAGPPVHGAYPFPVWGVGEVVADRYDPRLPRDVQAGDYTLHLRVGDLSLDLGTVTVQAADRVFDVPPISHPLDIALGDQVALLGYDLSADTAAPGDTLTLTLYWQALAEMDERYTVFTHLVAPDGSMTGQQDNQPVSGTYPTDLWLAGEVVVDVYEIAIPADAVPGEQRLEVGMYVAETGFRLPVAGTSDDAIWLQTITVGE